MFTLKRVTKPIMNTEDIPPLSLVLALAVSNIIEAGTNLALVPQPEVGMGGKPGNISRSDYRIFLVVSMNR